MNCHVSRLVGERGPQLPLLKLRILPYAPQGNAVADLDAEQTNRRVIAAAPDLTEAMAGISRGSGDQTIAHGVSRGLAGAIVAPSPGRQRREGF